MRREKGKGCIKRHEGGKIKSEYTKRKQKKNEKEDKNERELQIRKTIIEKKRLGGQKRGKTK